MTGIAISFYLSKIMKRVLFSNKENVNFSIDSNLENLKLGDSVMVYNKAFNPIISRLR